MSKHINRLVASAIALTFSIAAHAQDSSAPDAGAVSTPSNDIVVTGTPRRDGLSRLDAGFSISTISNTQIERLDPRSTADILKLVPGVYVETSGGAAGVNVGVRGFPQNGGGAFATVELDGSPIFAPNTLSFLETFSLFRIDDTIERTEVLRGGPNPVFSNGQPGLTVNFIQKKGHDTPEGSVRVTGGGQGMGRVDGYASGPLGNGWYVSGGGFYRFDDGVRHTQYVGDKGGQFTGNLTKRWDGLGEFNVYVRKVHDQNAFFSGAPLLSTNNGASLQVYPYFDQRHDTLSGNANRYEVLEVSPGATPGTVSRDFGDGRTIDLTQFGGSLNLTPGNGWQISDNFSFLDGSADVRAIFTSAVPTTLGAYISSRLAAASAVGLGAANSGTGTFVGGGTASASQPVIVAGLWSVDKDIRSFTDELRISKTVGANTLTVGGYFADYFVHDLWYQGNNALFAFEPNARLINITLDNGAQLTRNGIVSATTSQTRNDWHGQNLAGFAADEFKITEALRIDAGVRIEQFTANGTVGLTAANVDLDGNPATLYNNGSTVLNGGTRPVNYQNTKVSYTAGANWHFAPALSAFARVNSGYKFPQFDDLSAGATVVQKIDQYELGLKTSSRWFAAGLTLFYNNFNGQTYTQQIVNPDNSISTLTAVAGSRVYGVELDGVLRPVTNFEVHFNGTYMDAKFKNITGGLASGVQNGFLIQRQPSFQAHIDPSYTIPIGQTSLTLFGSYAHVGKRFSDIQNLQLLPGYDTLDVGATFKAGPMELQALVTNATNTLGLTEGNARIIGTTSGAVIGRSIFGRAFQLSALYKF